MKSELKTQLLAAMKAYIHSNNGECCCETCNAQAEADDDKGLNPRKSYDDCPVNKGMSDALAALEAAPVDDNMDDLLQKHIHLVRSAADANGKAGAVHCGRECRQVLENYTSGKPQATLVWRVSMVMHDTKALVFSGEGKTLDAAIKDCTGKIQQEKNSCQICGGKQGGKYAHTHDAIVNPSEAYPKAQCEKCGQIYTAALGHTCTKNMDMGFSSLCAAKPE